MNELERALYRDLSAWLVDERLPTGLAMTESDWWYTLHVSEVVGGLDPMLAGSDPYRAQTDAGGSLIVAPPLRIGGPS